ncbi:MAG: FAD-dependent oxidoreductase [Tetrasphaera sp.]
MTTSSAPTSRPDVIVVGGGIGGLGAAYALSRKGLRVRLLERANAFGEVGAGLQIAPNCTRILDDLGLLDEVKSLGVLPDRMVMKDAVDGGELTSLDLRDLERRYGFPYMVIHRSDLHSVLLRACERAGVELFTGQQCFAYENSERGARAVFADGHIEEAEVVIAADGLHSVARKLLVDDQPVNSAYVAYRGAMPMETVAAHDISSRRGRGVCRSALPLCAIPAARRGDVQPGRRLRVSQSPCRS